MVQILSPDDPETARAWCRMYGQDLGKTWDTCEMCKLGPLPLTMHHEHPVSQGGADSRLYWICARCHYIVNTAFHHNAKVAAQYVTMAAVLENPAVTIALGYSVHPKEAWVIASAKICERLFSNLNPATEPFRVRRFIRERCPFPEWPKYVTGATAQWHKTAAYYLSVWRDHGVVEPVDVAVPNIMAGRRGRRRARKLAENTAAAAK